MRLHKRKTECDASITINGTTRFLSEPTTVADLLEREGLAGKRVAVECDGEIVPKSLHASTLVLAGNNFEIVVAVGGG